MTTIEAIKELREASDSEVRYGDTDNHYDEVMKRVEAFDMAIKALEKEPCTDCISRKDVLAMKRVFVDEDGVMAYAVPTGNILRLLSVQPTRPTGKWIDIGDEGLVFKCSLCGNKNTIESHYCPNCGARMEAEV